jgi:uncharacterized membrane protein SpoIIM required for sporulation
MDLDAFSAARRREWSRLDELGSRRSLDGAEADELIERYQAGASDLSTLKTAAGSTLQGDRLSVALSRARLRFTGSGGRLFASVPHFFVAQLPAALYRLRWVSLAVAVGTALIAVAFAGWALADPRVLAGLGSEADFQRLADEDFVDYYSENPAASFTGLVWTNNAWIAAQCIAFGITGLYVPYILFANAQGLGVTAAAMFAYGEGDTFFLYIAPHGLLELTCVFVAAAAGLRIFWAWVAPGPRTRGQALAEDARALFSVAIGLTIFLFVSGVIEGYVTPAPWPWPVKIGIGILALAGFLGYMLLVGARAHRAGETGDLGEFDAGARRIVAG